MCTACLLPVSPSIHCTWDVSAPGGRVGGFCSGGGCLLPGEYLPLSGVVPASGSGGCTCLLSRAVPASGWGGVPASGLGAGGYLLLIRGGVSQHAMGQTPHPVNKMTDRCKNITLSQISFAGGKMYSVTSECNTCRQLGGKRK